MPRSSAERQINFEDWKQEKSNKSKAITSEDSATAAGEIGESRKEKEIDPVEYFNSELASIGRETRYAIQPGMSVEMWENAQKKTEEERQKLESIIGGLKNKEETSIEDATEYINQKMKEAEAEMEPQVQKEQELNNLVERMEAEEKAGEKEYGYLKFHAKNQEIDDLSARLKKEKQKKYSNKVAITDLELDISGAEFERDNTEYGKAAQNLIFAQKQIERINRERNRLDQISTKLKELR